MIWLGIAPVLLLVPAASFGAPPAREKRVAGDSSEIRADFPQLFRSGRVDMEPRPMPLPGDFVGLSGRDGGTCELSGSDLCYDLADRRLVYRPARHYMPRLEGLTAESVSLRRNAIRFKYTFK